MTDYEVQPIEVEGFADANAVYVNNEGAWLGEFDGERVQPYCDELQDFIPAPEGWEQRIIREL